jgi:hypothetical protein
MVSFTGRVNQKLLTAKVAKKGRKARKENHILQNSANQSDEDRK